MRDQSLVLERVLADRERSAVAQRAGFEPQNLVVRKVRHYADLLCVLLLTAVVVAAFWKTIVLQLPISRIALIAEWDSLFSALRRGSSLHIDPSAVLLALPTYTTIAAHYHAGHLPFWNNLNAFGSPLVGDIQATVFSPLRILFNLFPSMYTYNLQLVMQVEIAAVSTFFLCRNLNAARLPSVAAAIAYAFCPFVLWYLELQSGVGYVFNPLIAWLFVRTARLQTTRSAILAGLGAGTVIMMGHPETSFFAIVFACVAAGVLLWPHVVRSLRLVAIAGLAAFCTCAPIFLPFIEYARNSDCYKYAVTESAFMPWQAMLANLVSPVAGGASPFLGLPVLAFSLFALVVGWRKRNVLAMATFTLLAFILSAKLFPFSLVSHNAPFNYLITVYAVPVFLLGICALAALGLTFVVEEGKGLLALQLIALLVALPLTARIGHLNLTPANFDMTLTTSALNDSVVRRELIIGVLALLSTAAVLKWKRAVAVLVILNCVSVLCIAKSSLPAQARFELPKIPVMEFLHQSGERSLAVGTHLAKPDVNLLYGIDDVRSINAMLPPRYTSFVKACGASSDQFTQWFDDQVSPAVDFGAVRYIISQTPVTSTADAARSQRVLPPIAVDGVGQIVGGTLSTDLENRQVCGVIDWKFDSPAAHSAAITLNDSSGNTVWFSDRLTVSGRQAVRVPLPSKNWQDYSLSAVVDGTSIPIADVPPPAVSEGESRLKLIRDYDSGVRLYENRHAVPHFYFATDYAIASSREEALSLANDPNFPRDAKVILEHEPGFAPAPAQIQPVHVVSRESDAIVLEYNSDRQGLIVVSDTFYPGWKAFVDGARQPVLRANYLFRAVPVPAGKHTLTMRYYPESFTIGVLLFVAFWGFALVAIARKAL